VSQNSHRQPYRPAKIISGGQTGVDRGALDAAIELGIPHGGWCPRGRLAEDGTIPSRYELTETDSPEYYVRTEQNVLQSDATLILYRGQLKGGTELTRQLAERYRKPCLVVDLDHPPDVDEIRRWMIASQAHTLNVAGPRESQSPGISARSAELLKQSFLGV
jgi:hypothetical protein